MVHHLVPGNRECFDTKELVHVPADQVELAIASRDLPNDYSASTYGSPITSRTEFHDETDTIH